ncbi:InlB B-repeat-containing protein [Sediminitomix flava]|uniref:Repeat protein (TIGR02543 family) n=1 Tax=Sediminitomix flava TaxID=379075 RepID=A0A315ZIR7_SEDFL|nr:GLUG motif-containing protein [Sediminitomix flava]PWJ44594.1 hypothetical protein BC781_101965 [Sediminitomix flava]
MRKFYLFFILLGFTQSLWAQTRPTKGNGNSSDPFQIENLDHLRWLSEGGSDGMTNAERWNKNYILMADIDASETSTWNDGLGFSPIGVLPDKFQGNFNGNRHTISNLYINRPDEDQASFIGYALNALITNLGIVDANITGARIIGGIIGYSYDSDVKYCYTSGTLTGTDYVGGIMGYANDYSYVYDSFTSASISGNDKVGGIIGEGISYSRIYSSYAFGPIAGISNVGGIYGVANPAYAYNTYWDSETTGQVTDAYLSASSGLATSDFATVDNFSSWDFENVWTITTQTDIDSNPRPYLKWMLFDDYIEVFASPVEADKSLTETDYYNYGDEITLETTAHPGFTFSHWENAEGVNISTENPYTFTYSADSTSKYTAVFEYSFEFAGGDGSSSDPYQIETLEQLSYLSYVRSLFHKSFILINDIDATETSSWNEGKGFEPLGYDREYSSTGTSYSTYAFNGDFNGNNHVISNLTINRPTEEYIGLFGYLSNAKVYNLGLTDINIQGNNNVGAIVGYAYNSEVKSTYSTGQINGINYSGGIVGRISSSSIENSISFADITLSSNYGGGLTGYMHNSSIKNSYSTGSVTGNSSIGGLVGYYISGNITDSYWDKETSGLTSSSGSDDSFGLTTTQFSDISNFTNWDFNGIWEVTTLSDIDSNPRPYLQAFIYEYFISLDASPSEATANLEGYGGVVVDSEITLTTTAKNGYEFLKWTNSEGDSISNENSFTFVFTADSSTQYTAHFIENYEFAGGDGSSNDPYQIANLEQLEYLSNVSSLWRDSFILTTDIDASETATWNNGKGYRPIGSSNQPFYGDFDGNNHTISGLTINRQNEEYSGLFGYVLNASFQNIGLVDVNILGSNYTGALIGYNWNSSVSHAYSTGTVSGNEFVGGLLGYQYTYDNSAFVEHSFSSADIIAESRAGGLVGHLSSGYVENTYATGSITGSSSTGGIVGTKNSAGIVNNSYWDIETTGLTTSSGSLDSFGLTTLEFADASNFTNWDFQGNWEIGTQSDIDTNPRPYLQSFIYDYFISIDADPTNAIASFSGHGGIIVDSELTLEASAINGYELWKWTNSNGDSLSNTSPLTFLFTADSSIQYTAHFIENYEFAGGDGTVDNPYRVENLLQLEYISNVPTLWSKHFVLISDIDASETTSWNNGKGFKPIGQNQNNFTGSFNGFGYTISGLYINRPNEDYIGLFGYSTNARIENLTFTDFNYTGRDYVGGIAGYISNTDLSTLFAKGTINGDDNLGGLVGRSTSYTSIENVHSNVSITGDSDLGGIVGSFYDSRLSYSYAIGAVNGNYDNGGLIGYQSSSTINSSFWDTETTGLTSSSGSDNSSGLSTLQFSSVANFTDWNFNGVWGILTESSFEDVPRPYLMATLYDRLIDVKASPSYAARYFSGKGYHDYGEEVWLAAPAKSGFWFELWTNDQGDTVSTSNPFIFEFAQDSSLTYTAHFSESFGFAGGDGTVEDPYQINRMLHLTYLSNVRSLWDKHFILTADINAAETVTSNNGKGFSPIGNNEVDFIGSFNGNGFKIDSLHINRPLESYIGLFGSTNYSSTTISNVALTNANIVGYNYVGALVGYLDDAIVMNSYSTGSIRANKYSGGLVGYNYYADIKYSFSSCDIIANDYVGGLAGYIYYSSSIENSYAMGSVIGNNYTGGLTAYAPYSNYIINSYWDKETTLQTSSAGSDDSFGLATVDFADQNNFTDWDFENTWIMKLDESIDSSTRPYFKYMYYDGKIEISTSIEEAIATISGADFYNYQDEITLDVTPVNGYQFGAWVDAEGDTLSTTPSYTFTFTNESNLVYYLLFDETYEFAGGDGSSSDPYQIETLLQLEYLSNISSLWDKNFILVADIDASATVNWNDGKGFRPIGNNDKYFSGRFNGDEFKIYNLTINRPNEDYIGLFGHVRNYNDIRFISLRNVNIVGGNYVGAIAGYVYYSDILNSYSTGSVNGQNYVGGIVGYTSNSGSHITSTFSTASVTGNEYVGGLIGYNRSSNISKSYSIGAINGNEYVGGAIGHVYSGSINDIYWDKETTLQTSSAGSDDSFGLTTSQFENQESFTNWDFDNTWVLQDDSEIDSNTRPYLQWMYYDTQTEIALEFHDAAEIVSGSGGLNYDDEITLEVTPVQGYIFEAWLNAEGDTLSYDNPYTFTFTEDSPTTYYARFDVNVEFEGGDGSSNDPYQIATLEQLNYLSTISAIWNRHFVLIADIDASETSSWNDGKGFRPIGNNSSQFNGTFNGAGNVISNLYINRPLENYVGLFGRTTSGNIKTTIKNVGLLNANITGDDRVGAIAGYLYQSTVSHSFATGIVNGGEYVGGIVGRIYYSDISNSFSNCDVTASSSVGGIVGSIDYNSNVINSYALGAVSGSYSTGGIAGYHYTDEYIQNSYWDKETTGLSTSPGVDDSFGLTTSQFAEQENFANWDFHGTWLMETNTDIDSNPRPYLQWMYFDAQISVSEQPTYASTEFVEIISANYDQEVTLSVNPKNGYAFEAWISEAGDTLSTVNPYTFTFTEESPLEITAQFKEDYEFVDGDGSYSNPYQIETLAQLEFLSNVRSLWDRNFVLISDIDASETSNWNEGKGFSPIGDNNHSFYGRFDGNSHIISNLYINRDQDFVGLFGNVYGTIKQLGLKDASIKGANQVGGLAGDLDGTIESCFVSGNIEGNVNIGGLSGYVYRGNLLNSFSLAEVSGIQNVGGVIGSLEDESEANTLYASGNVSGQSNTGGAIGYASSSSKVEIVYWDTQTTGQSSSSGSLSFIFGLSTINFSQEFMLSGFDFGGIWEITTLNEFDENPRPYLQWQLYDDYISIYSTPSEASETISGHGGVNNGDEVTFEALAVNGYVFSHWETVDGDSISSDNPYTFTFNNGDETEYIAQFENAFSFAGGDGSIHDPYQISTLDHLEYLSNVSSLWNRHYILINDIDATATQTWNQSQGLKPIGNQNNSFTGSFNGQGFVISNLEINYMNEKYVGLFGRISYATIKNVGLTNAYVLGKSYVGTLIGYADQATISHNYVTGHANSLDGDYVGGMVGYLYYSNLSFAIANVSTSANNYAGGLVGRAAWNSYINYSYSIGQVSGSNNIGGIAGSSYYSVENSYWDKETSGVLSSSGSDDSFGLTTAQFSDSNNFAGWDFEATWAIATKNNFDSNARPMLNIMFNKVFVKANNSEWGSVEGEGYFLDDQVITIDAYPNYGYHFKGWELDGQNITKEESFTLQVKGNYTFTANFEINSYNIDIVENEYGTITFDNDSLTHGSDVTYTITPDEGYVVTSVFMNGFNYGSFTSNTYTNITSDIEMEVLYTKITSADDLSEEINVYPVPTSTTITISDIAPNRSIKIFNLTGIEVLSTISNSSSETIDLSALSTGVYLIQVEGYKMQRIVKE